MTDETDAAGEPTTSGDPGSTSPGVPRDAPTSGPAGGGPGAAEPPAAPAAPAGRASAGASVAAFARKHRVALSITGGALAVALLGTGAVVAGATLNAGDPRPDTIAASAPATPTPTADPARPAPAAAIPASRIRTCSVADR